MGRAQAKPLPPQLTAYGMISQRKHPYRQSFPEQPTSLLHPSYQKMISNFKYEFTSLLPTTSLDCELQRGQELGLVIAGSPAPSKGLEHCRSSINTC